MIQREKHNKKGKKLLDNDAALLFHPELIFVSNL